jgi:hypothetical protein
MPDYWIKITEREEEDIRHHHYLIEAKDEKEARKLALRFMERFIDDDENPEKIDEGYSFYNNAISSSSPTSGKHEGAVQGIPAEDPHDQPG